MEALSFHTADLAAVTAHFRPQGYAVVILRTLKDRRGKQLRRMMLQCEHGKRKTPSIATKYNTTSSKRDCPWAADIFRTPDDCAPEGYLWAVRIPEPRNNHEPPRRPGSIPIIRQDVRREAEARVAADSHDSGEPDARLKTLKGRVEDLSNTCTMTARVIAEQLTREF